MSRIGLRPISVPDKVQVQIRDRSVTVKGPMRYRVTRNSE